jgi:hypothetical protein
MVAYIFEFFSKKIVFKLVSEIWTKKKVRNKMGGGGGVKLYIKFLFNKNFSLKTCSFR